MSNFRTYLRQSRTSSLGAWTLLRMYPRWKAALQPGRTSVGDESPWIGFAVIDYLDRYLNAGMKVFEWGSGGSTLFFSRRVAQVASAEHDRQWHDQVSEILKTRNLSHCDLRLAEAGSEAPPCLDVTDPHCYCSDDKLFVGKSFQLYATMIDQYPDRSFDVILVDGRARPSCFKHALPKIKPGGVIVWDNTERERYWPAMKLAPANAVRKDFVGPCPYLPHFTTTTIWQMP
jgi:hypothetical protein